MNVIPEWTRAQRILRRSYLCIHLSRSLFLNYLYSNKIENLISLCNYRLNILFTFTFSFLKAVKFMTNEVKIVIEPSATKADCIGIDAISLIGSSVLMSGTVYLVFDLYWRAQETIGWYMVDCFWTRFVNLWNQQTHFALNIYTNSYTMYWLNTAFLFKVFYHEICYSRKLIKSTECNSDPRGFCFISYVGVALSVLY